MCQAISNQDPVVNEWVQHLPSTFEPIEEEENIEDKPKDSDSFFEYLNRIFTNNKLDTILKNSVDISKNIPNEEDIHPKIFSLNGQARSKDKGARNTARYTRIIFIRRLDAVKYNNRKNLENQAKAMHQENQELKHNKLTYNTELVVSHSMGTQTPGIFKITSLIQKPHEVFVWAVNSAKLGSESGNPLDFNTYAAVGNSKFVDVQLETNNGTFYPTILPLKFVELIID